MWAILLENILQVLEDLVLNLGPFDLPTYHIKSKTNNNELLVFYSFEDMHLDDILRITENSHIVSIYHLIKWIKGTSLQSSPHS